MAVKVSYAEGRYEDYITSGTYVPGRIYYLIDDNGNTYIYLNGEEYTGVDGGAEPDKIEFPNAITITKATGNYSVGDVIPANTNLLNLITNMLSKVEITKTYPKIRIIRPNYNGMSYEIGSKIGGDYSIYFDDGSYSASGFSDIPANCSDTSYVVSCPITGQTYYTNIGTLLVNYQLTQTGTFTVISAYATYSDGDIPIFNNVSYPDDQIQAGTTSIVEQTINVYRACFYGYTDNDTYDFSRLNGDQIRTLGGNGQYKDIPSKIPSSGSISSLKQLFLAAPHGKYTTITMKNQDNIPQNLQGPYQVNVKGKNDFDAISYDVWYLYNTDAASNQILTITKS